MNKLTHQQKTFSNSLSSIYKKLTLSFFIFTILILFQSNSKGQALDVSSCPTIDKRSNGNGQASSSAGDFRPTYLQNNPVAANVVGTSYQNVPFDPTTKTGNYHLLWNSATDVNNVPVITRVWWTRTGGTTGTLLPTKFGPPAPPVKSGTKYYVNYAFYVQNMPPAGKITLEFTDPQTKRPAFSCTYDLQTNEPADPPIIDCSPTIINQPTNSGLCGASSATFTVAADGVSSFQWQVSESGTSGWSNISNGGDYSGATSANLVISNPSSYDGKYYHVVLTGSSGSCTTTSNAALLISKPAPTATFANSSLCGTGTQSLAVNLTGTAPWSITYNNGGAPVTKSNISTSPYYISASGSATYTITSVSDAYCTNGSPSGNVAATLYAAPTITPSNATACSGSNSFRLTYTSTGSPNRYTLTAGVRAMPDFNTISNSVLGASPATISIPATAPIGTYDFNIVVTNSATGCVSASVPFTVTVAKLPTLTATAGSGTVCAGSTVALTAAPGNLASYAWTISPSATVLSTEATYSPTINSNTTYTVIGTDGNGCSSAAAKVSVTTLSGPLLTISPDAPTICSGNATTLTATGGNTYTWSPSTGLSATSGDVVVASPSVTTTYTITSKNAIGCQSVGTVEVTVSSPLIGVTASETICAGSIKTLTATGGSTYVWYPSTGLYTDAGASTPYTGTSVATVYAKPTTTTTYYVKGTTAGGCSGIASSTVTLSPAPINAATSTANNVIFCTQSISSFPLNVVMNSAVSSANWSYSTDGITYTSFTGVTTITGVTLTPSSSGSSPTMTYTCTLSAYGSAGYTGARYFRLVIVGSSCTYNYDIFITDTKKTNPTPAPTANQLTICSGNSVTLSVGNLEATYNAQWQSSPNNSTWTNVGSAIAGPTALTLTVSPASSTYYRVVYDGGGGNCGSTSNSTLITVASAISENSITPATTCTTGSGTITLNGSAITGGIYQW